MWKMAGFGCPKIKEKWMQGNKQTQVLKSECTVPWHWIVHFWRNALQRNKGLCTSVTEMVGCASSSGLGLQRRSPRLLRWRLWRPESESWRSRYYEETDTSVSSVWWVHVIAECLVITESLYSVVRNWKITFKSHLLTQTSKVTE